MQLDFFTAFGIAVGLAMDAFAVSISMGVTLPNVRTNQVLRLALAFGGFQFLMPVVGWMAGRLFSDNAWVTQYDHWIAFILLAVLGGKMIYEARFLPEEEEQCVEKDPTKSFTLILLAIATSIDALAVGLSLSLLRVRIFQPSVIIGLTAAGFSMVGVHLGRKFGHHLGSKMEIVGGLALIAIGLKILAEHTLGTP